MRLVSGYDSDSEEDTPGAPTGETARESNLAQQSQSSTASTPSSSVKAGGKRKADRLQIRVEALKDGDDGAGPEKKPKFEFKRAQAGLKSHGLFSLLPAPSNPVKVSPAANKKGETNSLGVSNDSNAGALQITEGEPANDGASSGKPKGNADFRAMLGLAPKAAHVIQKARISDTVTSDAQRPAAPAVQDAAKQDGKPTNHVALFTMSEGGGASVHPLYRSKVSTVSAAPAISVDDEALQNPAGAAKIGSNGDKDPYAGWQQGSDGSWFPVTPEAHEQYAAHLSSSAADIQARSVDHVFDANDGGEQAASSTATAQASNAAMDKRYALAAASVASSGTRVDLSGLDQDDDRRDDKATNVRARRKGQLSSLIAQAEESREKLEERWARGKVAREEAQRRYGF